MAQRNYLFIYLLVFYTRKPALLSHLLLPDLILCSLVAHLCAVRFTVPLPPSPCSLVASAAAHSLSLFLPQSVSWSSAAIDPRFICTLTVSSGWMTDFFYFFAVCSFSIFCQVSYILLNYILLTCCIFLIFCY